MSTPSSVPQTTSQDERVMAAIAHASAILPMWGIIAAIVIWATQKNKSRFVHFQALQAAVYQVAVILGSFLLGACYMCSIFAFPIAGMLAESGAGCPQVRVAVSADAGRFERLFVDTLNNP